MDCKTRLFWLHVGLGMLLGLAVWGCFAWSRRCGYWIGYFAGAKDTVIYLREYQDGVPTEQRTDTPLRRTLDE